MNVIRILIAPILSVHSQSLHKTPDIKLISFLQSNLHFKYITSTIEYHLNPYSKLLISLSSCLKKENTINPIAQATKSRLMLNSSSSYSTLNPSARSTSSMDLQEWYVQEEHEFPNTTKELHPLSYHSLPCLY